MNKRIEYIDVAKGIVILCLLYGHMWVYASILGYKDNVIQNGFKSVVFYNSFFMQTFFLITGFCSSFNIKYYTFVWKNLKTLIIPSLVLCTISYLFNGFISGFNKNLFEFIYSFYNWLTDGGPWFIISLFWAKIIYWGLNRTNIKIQLFVVLLLYVLGLFLNKHGVRNIQWHQHTFMMLPYLMMGHFVRMKFHIIQPYLKYIGICGVICISIQTLLNYLYNSFVPTHDLYINVTYKTIPLHCINVMLGTSFVIWASSSIKYKGILQNFGRGTLICYLLNGMVQIPVLHLFNKIYDSNNYFNCILFYSLSYFSTVIIFYFLIKIIYDNSYLKWIVGKY